MAEKVKIDGINYWILTKEEETYLKTFSPITIPTIKEGDIKDVFKDGTDDLLTNIPVLGSYIDYISEKTIDGVKYKLYRYREDPTQTWVVNDKAKAESINVNDWALYDGGKIK